ncbi:MAG: lipoate--protein ligase family protein, partial [Pelolinea sp.]|nr:lipoate--protein ligase family protein [Pelolinea sp.]
MQNNIWRLIITSPASGPRNMALDEAILENVMQNHAPPTLRLYSWYPASLSIGHAQPISEVNIDYLKINGWDIVRRPTGGRAILHTDELTYSVCAPLDGTQVRGGVIESYRQISQCLLRALELSGIEADAKPKVEQDRALSKDPVCFQYPSDYEITFHGKKIIGSAQARKTNGLLQHGSIPLFGDITRIISALNFDTEENRIKAKNRLSDRATTLQAAHGDRISWKLLANSIV